MKNSLFVYSMIFIFSCVCTVSGCDQQEDKQTKTSDTQDDQKDSKKDDKKKKTNFSLADGRIKMEVSGAWKKVEPKFRMINVEFSIPSEIDGQPDGRTTMMGAGGGIEANIDRWAGQFEQSDGSETKPKIVEKTIADQDVTFVDITGTYRDKPIPIRDEFTRRKDYRMLAAIIETDGIGNYFVKFYGNKKTVDKHEKAFYEMINSMKIEK